MKHLALWAFLLMVPSAWANDAAFRAGNFEDAEAGYRALLKINPGEALRGLGTIALLANRIGEAEEFLHRARAHAPRGPLAKGQRGSCLSPSVRIEPETSTN